MKMYSYLTYLGAIPFIICTICLAIGIKIVPPFGEIEQTLSVYSLIIATFIAGSYWGQSRHLHNKWRYYLPILSNIITIALWLGFVILSLKPLLVSSIGTFIILLIIEQRLLQYQFITRQYFHTRCSVTIIVVVALFIAAINT